MSTSPESRFAQAAYAEEPIEAEMIQGLLEGAGIPSLLQPAGLNSGRLIVGSARPGYAHGPQRVMLHDLWSFGFVALTFGVFVLLRG